MVGPVAASWAGAIWAATASRQASKETARSMVALVGGLGTLQRFVATGFGAERLGNCCARLGVAGTAAFG